MLAYCSSRQIWSRSIEDMFLQLPIRTSKSEHVCEAPVPSTAEIHELKDITYSDRYPEIKAPSQDPPIIGQREEGINSGNEVLPGIDAVIPP